MTRIEAAIIFATEAHRGQLRKDGVTPYIVHPLGVAESVRRAGGSEAQYIAALLHDTVEDCDVHLGDISINFGAEVAVLVASLTNVYTKEAFPDLNREARKKLEDERIAKISDEAKLVKLCDIAYNINDLEGMGGFKHRLLKEKKATVEAIIANTSPESVKVMKLAYRVLDQIVTKRFMDKVEAK
jgi:guanosine-3',5'-bis(diphosphate) 3'-pyrophosphohydrolase